MTNEQPYYETREEENQYVDMYMNATDTSAGQSFHAGGIYSIPKWKADQLKGNGSAMPLDIAPLKDTTQKIDTITATLKAETEKIKADDHLSDLGKKEKIKLLIQQAEVMAESVQNQYANEIEVLKQYETKKAAQSVGTSKMDPHEARTQAGLLKASVAVAPTLEKAIEAVKTKLPHLDSAVSRELLAQYADIKRDLTSMSKGDSAHTKAKDWLLISGLYNDLLAASTSPEQAKANEKVKLLEAIQQQRGDVRTMFKQVTRGLTRYVDGYNNGIR